MIFLFMIIFIFVGQSFSMQPDEIDKDYAVLVPYVVRMLQVTKDDYLPFQLLKFLASPDALINSSVRCTYLSPSEHLQYLLRRQRIGMGKDYEAKEAEYAVHEATEQKDLLFSWFLAYFQTTVVDRAKAELRQERDQKTGYETNSSNGV